MVDKVEKITNLIKNGNLNSIDLIIDNKINIDIIVYLNSRIMQMLKLNMLYHCVK